MTRMIDLVRPMEGRTLAAYVDVGPARLYFSYETLIAYSVPGVRRRLPNLWGNTTGKHINGMGCRDFEVVDTSASAFADEAWMALVAHLGSVGDPDAPKAGVRELLAAHETESRHVHEDRIFDLARRGPGKAWGTIVKVGPVTLYFGRYALVAFRALGKCWRLGTAPPDVGREGLEALGVADWPTSPQSGRMFERIAWNELLHALLPALHMIQPRSRRARGKGRKLLLDS